MKKKYASCTKNELLEEIERLQERIDRFETTDANYRPDVKLDFNETLFSSDRDLVNTVLGKIEEFVYFIEINSDGSKLVRYVGPQLKKILGINTDTYLADATALIDRCHPDDLPGVYDVARKLRMEKKQQTFIYRFLHAELNEYVWLEETVFPQFDAVGKYTANLGIIRNVTERIESDNALRESRMALEKVLNTIDETIYHIDMRKDSGMRIKFVSESIETVFGITKEAFLNDKDIFLQYYHPEDLEKIKQTSEDLKNEKEPKLYYYRFRHPKTENYIWIEERVTPWFDEEGRLTEIFGVARDVTEQKTAEEKLIKSEERFRVVAQNASDMVFRYRFFPERRYVFVSPSAETITGYTPEEFYADPLILQKMTLPDDVELLHQSTDEILAGHPEVNSPMILRNMRKDGENIWTETRYNPTYDEAGRIIAIDGITRDITASKKSELEMIESRESYKSLVEQNPDGIIIADFNLKMLYANNAASTISGIKEIIGHSFTEFVSEEQQKKTSERLKKIQQGQNVPFEIIQIKQRDGTLSEAEARPSVYNYLGKPAILIFLRNINAERKLEKEQMRAQLAEESNRILTKEVEERKRTESELFAAQKNLRLLIDSSLDMICASDKRGYITEFNKAAQQTFGYAPEEVIGKHLSFLYLNPDQRIDVMDELTHGEGNYQGEVVNRKKDGNTFTALLSASILKDEKGNVIGAMGVSRDITASKHAENQLRLNEEKYRAIYNQAYIGIALVGTNNDSYIDVNQRLCDMLGFSAEELRKKTVHELRKPGDLSRLPAGKEFIERGFERIIDEHRYGHKNGSIVIVNVTISLVRSEDMKPLYFVYVYEDLTPKRRAEEQIRIQGAKLNAVFESSSHMIWTIDQHSRLTSFNQNQADWIKRYFGITAYVGLLMASGKMISTQEHNNFWNQKIEATFSGASQSFEVATEKDGEKSWREIHLNPIFDENDRVVEISCIANDITDKKMVDEQIRLSLKEKEVLLKEVHHRVKNNLQVISSILNLQSSYVKDKRVLEILLESQNRIKSMAFVHESLYQTKDFSNISFREYVENISRNLVHSYAATDSPPLLNLDLDDIQLNLDTAIPCGLIINELLTNSLKYAFPVGKQGKIDIVIRENAGNITIDISDSGKGLPKEIDFRNTESLGLQLVVSLVEQINGKIKLDTKKGTKFTIEFST
ncbi:MAG: PAS domain S-box protein [Bacteroidia bacterium]